MIAEPSIIQLLVHPNLMTTDGHDSGEEIDVFMYSERSSILFPCKKTFVVPLVLLLRCFVKVGALMSNISPAYIQRSEL